MLGDLQDTLKEWIPAVPKRWYNMLLNVLLPIIPFAGSLIFAILQSVRGLPVPIWAWIVILVSVLAFVILSLAAFHRVRLERDRISSDNTNLTTDLKRQERREWRSNFRDRATIPTILFKMYERIKYLCKGSKKSLTQEHWKDIADKFFDANQAPTIVPSLEKMPSLQDIIAMINSTPQPFNTEPTSITENFNRLILNLQATMGYYKRGAIPLSQHDPEYQTYHKEVKLLQNNLPNSINTKIESCILMSNGLANLLCADFDTTETPVPSEFQVIIQYIIPSMDNMAQRMRDEISEMIEDFLLGE